MEFTCRGTDSKVMDDRSTDFDNLGEISELHFSLSESCALWFKKGSRFLTNSSVSEIKT